MLIEIILDALTAIGTNRKRIKLLILSVGLSVWMIMMIFSLKSAVQDVVYAFLANEYAVTQSVTCKFESESSDNYEYGLTQHDLELLQKSLPESCKNIVVKSDKELAGTILNGKSQKVTVNGVSYGYFDCMKLELLKGRFFGLQDYSRNYSCVVISDIVAENCFGSIDNALGSKLLFFEEKGLSIELYVVGVYRDKNVNAEKKRDLLTQYNTIVYCTNNFVNDLVKEDNLRYKTFYVVLNDIREIENVASYLEGYLNDRFLRDKECKVKVYGLDIFREMYDIIDMIVMVFMILVIIVFFVSGISIMNVMMVSVRRRTREIGIQKALGEKSAWIKLQFVLEAVFICMFGEMAGLLLGYISIYILSEGWEFLLPQMVSEEVYVLLLDNVEFFPSGDSIIISIIYCLCTSIIFGLLPANRAANLLIVDALRFKN